MLSPQQVNGYLARLHYRGKTAPDLATLRALHRLHMLYLPFENIDIFLGRKIDLATDALHAKLVTAERGGFCYELNYLFCSLLRALDFEVQLLSANVFNGQAFGPPFDHLLLLVSCNGDQFIADVGFGDSFRQPLRLNGPAVIEAGASYDVVRCEQSFTLRRQKGVASIEVQYRFDLAAHAIEAFHARCLWQQRSPNSHFTQKALCSIATEEGRLSLSNMRLIRSERGTRTEQTIVSEAAWHAALHQYFGLSLSTPVPMERLR